MGVVDGLQRFYRGAALYAAKFGRQNSFLVSKFIMDLLALLCGAFI
jgi:hypothetical protein